MKMEDNMTYKIRVMIQETYVRITMIGYESKQSALNARRRPGSSSGGGHNT